MKTCSKCRMEKPVSSFSKASAAPDGLMWECRECIAARHQARRLADPAYVRRRHLRVRYGLTLEQYDERLAAQGGRCAICRTPPTPDVVLYVDHDHACCPGSTTCGACLRGLLCDACNRGLGFFRDDPERLAAATTYLSKRRSSL